MKPVCVNIILVLAAAAFALGHAASIVEQPLGDHDLILGDCTNTPDSDRVFYDHVDKAAIPFVVRTETEKYEGDGNIYCIQALNQKADSGDAYIKTGGVSYSFATIELESSRGHGLEYYVSIYAK